MAQREQKPKLHIPKSMQLRIGVAKANFNSAITNAQLQEVQRFAQEYNITTEVTEVAGCYELPYALQRLANTKQYDALVALGCLIKGETIHFEVISYSVANAIQELVQKHSLPIGFGIITANTPQQAEDRIYTGYDATYAAIDSLLQFQ